MQGESRGWNPEVEKAKLVKEKIIFFLRKQWMKKKMTHGYFAST